MDEKTTTQRVAELEAEVADLRSQLGMLLGMLYLKETGVVGENPSKVMTKITSHPEDIRLLQERTASGFKIRTVLEPRDEPQPVRRDAWTMIAED